MTKQILNASLSFFLIVCGIAVLAVTFSAKSFLEENRLLAQSAHETQKQLFTSAVETREIVTDIGFGFAVLMLSEQKIIPPASTNKLLEETIKAISKRSDRFGKLARYINDYRINQQANY